MACALLGTGAFGEVYLVEKLESGEKYAMKVLKKKTLSKISMTDQVTFLSATLLRNEMCFHRPAIRS